MEESNSPEAQESKFEPLQSALKGLDKTLKNLHNLLDDEEDLEENMDSALVLLKKYQSKVKKAILIINPDFEKPAPVTQQNTISAPTGANGDIKFPKLDYEFFPNEICARIFRAQKALVIPESLESPKNSAPFEGPYLIVTETNGQKSRASYLGQFKNGIQNGRGRMIYDDGTYLEGEWEDGVLNGTGRVISWDGILQEGQFTKGVPNGKGRRETYPNLIGGLISLKTTYVGDFVDGAMTGKGKKTYYGGDYYEGSFLNGLRNGMGVETYYGQSCNYDGDWIKDNKEGKGVETYKNGDRYEGLFEKSMKNGEGVYTW